MASAVASSTRSDGTVRPRAQLGHVDLPGLRTALPRGGSIGRLPRRPFLLSLAGTLLAALPQPALHIGEVRDFPLGLIKLVFCQLGPGGRCTAPPSPRSRRSARLPGNFVRKVKTLCHRTYTE